MATGGQLQSCHEFRRRAFFGRYLKGSRSLLREEGDVDAGMGSEEGFQSWKVAMVGNLNVEQLKLLKYNDTV